MPEIAEVRLIADNLRTFLQGRKVKYIELNDPVVTENWAKRGAKGLEEIQKEFKRSERSSLLVLDVKTKGKFCWIELEKDWKIMIQFGMSGNIRKEPTDEYLHLFNQSQKKPITRNEYLKHCHLKITYYDSLNDESINTVNTIYYHDIRRFGTWIFTKDSTILTTKLNKLGHDPLQEDPLNDLEIIKVFRYHNYSNICKILMNQEGPLAGVGNYIRIETMYSAKIHPLAIIKDIPDNSLVHLYQEIRKIAESAYQLGGASLYTYTGMNGDQSDFKNTLKVYKRVTDSLGNRVVHIQDKQVPGGRSLFYVPEIQIIGKPTPTADFDTSNKNKIKISKIHKKVT